MIDITEAEGVKKRWQKYTELCKKDHNDPHKYSQIVFWIYFIPT